MKHTFSTINFNPYVKFKVDISLSSCAIEAPVDGSCGPTLCEQLVNSSKACGFFTRRMSAERTTDHHTAVKWEEFLTNYSSTCNVNNGLHINYTDSL